MATIEAWRSLFKNRLVAQQIQVIQVRHRRIVSRNPREPHFLKKRMLEVCEPIIARDPRPDSLRCARIDAKPFEKPAHPFEQLLAKEMQKDWINSRLICFYHVNPITEVDKRLTHNALFKQDMQLRFYNKATCTWALVGTPYESALHLLQEHTALLFSAEPNVAKVLKFDKKMPHFHLLGGIVDDHFLSKEELVAYSRLPSLEGVRGQLCSLLSHVGGGATVRHLTHHQQQLHSLLDRYQRQEDRPS